MTDTTEEDANEDRAADEASYSDETLDTLSDDYIRDLEPESQRYDITLAPDFVISVLPNGIKTWAFIYDFQGRHRRKTLGVFPEMSFDDARTALNKARESMQRMDEPTVAPNEFGQRPAVLSGGHYRARKEKKPINFQLWLRAIAAVVALAILAGAAKLGLDWYQSRPSTTSAQDAPRPDLPFAINTAEDRAPAAELSNPGTPPGTTSTQTPTRPDTASPAPAVTTPTAPSSSTRPASDDRSPVSNDRPTSNTTSSRAPASTSTTGRDSPPPLALANTTATAYGGRVSRSRLTTGVQDLEPVDTLGPEITYKNSGFTRVFYFTELREFSDGVVVHRWLLNGEIQDIVELKVKKSWRWRTYSNKDITPGLNGEWRVETIDATGKILDTESFTYDYR
ncbi:MAG: DUF2914 domain-containing protein [Pseudomonadota bacterium]